MAVDVAEIDMGAPGSLRTTWFRFVISDPTSFHAVILLAACNYVFVYGTDLIPDILVLKQRAINSVIEALEEPGRQSSDQIIAATLKLASYEAIYGTFSTYKIHMEGLKQMLLIRGILDEKNTSTQALQALMMRMAIWVQTNAGFINNSSVKFFWGQKKITPNPRAFVGPSWSTDQRLLDSSDSGSD
jgi:hypothetical protein